MKPVYVVILVLSWASSLSAQHPSNDQNWGNFPTWSDEFTPSSATPEKPNPSKWLYKFWWEGPPEAKYLICNMHDGSNTLVHWGSGSEYETGMLTFYVKREDKTIPASVEVYDDEGNFSHWRTEDNTFNYTTGTMSTGWGRYNFDHGYYELKMRLPANFNTNAFGDYYNMAWWLFERDQSLDEDWSELDFFEQVVGHLTFNAHIVKPWLYNDDYNKWYNNTYGGTAPGYSNPAFTDIGMVDPNGRKWLNPGVVDFGASYQNFKKEYYRYYLNDGNWHTYACEWLPDQLKYYLDGKLLFRLEGNFPCTYKDIYNNLQAVNLVHELKLPMPMLLGIGINPTQVYQGSADPIEVDIDYVRYYRLKKDCDNDFTVGRSTDSPNFNFCSSFDYDKHKVYDQVTIGENGCVNCHAEVNSGCRVSIRANNIRLEDGFKVGEGEFYAHDINCEDLP